MRSRRRSGFLARAITLMTLGSLSVIKANSVHAENVVETETPDNCERTCDKLRASGQEDEYSAVVSLSKINKLIDEKHFEKYQFAEFDVYGIPKQIATFKATIENLKDLGIYGELLTRIGRPHLYSRILLTGHPEILLGGSTNTTCIRKCSWDAPCPPNIPLNRDGFFFIDLDVIKREFPACMSDPKESMDTSYPRWMATQCGIVAHELVEAAQVGGAGNAHAKGIAMQNAVRQAYGGYEEKPERILIGERCYTGAESSTDCRVVYKAGSIDLVEIIHRSCDNRISSLSYQECTNFESGIDDWEACEALEKLR